MKFRGIYPTMNDSVSGAPASADEHHLRQLIEVSPIACVLTDMRVDDYPIIAVNAAFVELTGYPADEIVGRNCRFLSGPSTDPAARALLRDAITTGRSAVVELTNYRRDGTPFRNAVILAPLLDSDGNVAFYMGSQMDASMGGGDRRAIAQAAIASLSRRQLEVLRAMARGLRHAAIAKELGITEKTVKMHRGALVRKLGCRTSAEAIRLAIEAGL